MYKFHKEFGEDMTYESEVKYDMDDRGNLDLTKQIETLKIEVKKLKTEKEKILKDQDIKNDRHQIEMLEKDRDLNIKDKEIGRLMAKVSNGR